MNALREQLDPNPTKIGRKGKAAMKTWAKSEWVNIDLSQDSEEARAYKAFFYKWYEAGLLNIKPWDVYIEDSDAIFPSFLEDKFYQAGMLDRAA